MELLFFAHDHSLDLTLTVAQLAALPKVYDLVTHQAAGWKWGKEEIANPWFRIVTWSSALAADLDTLLAALVPSGGTKGTPEFLGQYRGFYLDLKPANLNLPVGFSRWWLDDGRTQQAFAIPAKSTLSVANSKTARLAMANPAFIGTTPSVIG